MNEKIKKFMEYISSHEELKAELKTALEGVEQKELVSTVIRFAEKHGYELTEQDFVPDFTELNPEECEAVTGGAGSGCGCAGMGFGYSSDIDGLQCVCAVYGTGGVNGSFPSSQGGCQCLGVGAGASNRH